MDIKCVTVIGLGLIGGSIAKALNEKVGIKKIIGIDLDQKVVLEALKEGVISQGYTDTTPDIYDSDIVFLCTPINKTLEWIQKIIPYLNQGCILTDTGSTKSQLIGKIEQLPDKFIFVGGHPMAGSEKSGFSHSQGHLFENAYYILSPCTKSTPKAVQTLSSLVRQFGSLPLELPAHLHDHITGAISHVPHVLSAALVNMVKEADTKDQFMQKLAAGGFKDITRISSSNPEMWQSICFENEKAVIEILNRYINILREFVEDLQSKKDRKVYDFFSTAKTFRDSFASRVTSLIPGTYELIVDVVDRPGIIGEVATLLGKNGINIKNMNINNNREFDGGVLIISLADIQSLEKADEILTAHGYRVNRRK